MLARATRTPLDVAPRVLVLLRFLTGTTTLDFVVNDYYLPDNAGGVSLERRMHRRRLPVGRRRARTCLARPVRLSPHRPRRSASPQVQARLTGTPRFFAPGGSLAEPFV